MKTPLSFYLVAAMAGALACSDEGGNTRDNTGGTGPIGAAGSSSQGGSAGAAGSGAQNTAGAGGGTSTGGGANTSGAFEITAATANDNGATALVVALKRLERAFGRRERERWGPRELDLDLIVFGRARLELDRPPAGMSLDPGKADRLLVVPHRDAAQRLFVLAPLADLAPGLVPPGWHETVATAAARRRAIEGPAAARPLATWDAAARSWTPLPA